MMMAITNRAVLVIREGLLVDLGHLGVWDEVQGLVGGKRLDWKKPQESVTTVTTLKREHCRP